MMRHLWIVLSFCFSLITFDASATQVQEVISPKGFKAWLVEEHGLPLIAVKIAFEKSGFAYDSNDKQGRASMVAALLMEGAGDMDSRAFNEALENNAIRMDFDIDEDIFQASVETLSEHRDKAFGYLGLALTKPRFDDGAIERVRGQTLSILTQEERNPGYQLHRAWQKLAFGQHPYSNPILGTRQSVSALGRADFEAFSHRFLTRDNILIAVVGDITPMELGRLLDDNLADLPPHYQADHAPLSDTKLPVKANQLVVDNDVPQTMVAFGTNGLKRDDPDYYAAYVMNQILGGGGNLSSRLATEIRGKRGLAYSIGTQMEPMAYSAVWGGEFATRNAEVGKALQTLRDTLKDFSTNGPTDKEIADAKQYLTGSFVLGLDSNSGIASYLISMQIFHLGRDYLDKRNQLINAASKDQIKKVAKELTDPSKLLVVMAGKPNLGADKKP